MRPPCTVQSPTQNRLRPAVDTPDVEQTFSERETSVAISPSKSQGPKVAAFTLSVPPRLFRAECGCCSLRQPVDLDKGGNFGPDPSASISTLCSSVERRAQSQHFIAIFSTLPRARVVRSRLP